MNKLAEIQQALKAPKGQKNKFGNYYYRSCEDILEAVKPLLGECSLTLSDEMVEIGGRVYVKATACLGVSDSNHVVVHGWAREAEDKKGMDAAQITGAASSYARKYALNGLFCIDDTKDADATNDHGKASPAPAKPAPAKPITDTQKENLYELRGKAAIADDRYQTGLDKVAGKEGATVATLTQPQAATFIKQITSIIKQNKITTKA